jgi:hypothetical protein
MRRVTDSYHSSFHVRHPLHSSRRRFLGEPLLAAEYLGHRHQGVFQPPSFEARPPNLLGFKRVNEENEDCTS